MNEWFDRISILAEKYERHISSLALVGGFIFDSLTLQGPDLLFDNLAIISYLAISGGSILLVNYWNDKMPQRTLAAKLHNFLPFFMQFAFGGLFSAFFIFYSRSGSLVSSWLFIFIMLGLLVGNEFFRNYYQRLTFQVSIFFVAIFSFTIFFIPVVLKAMGAWVFLLSGMVSLLIIFLFLKAAFKVAPEHLERNRILLRNTVGSIFIFINILYFTNLIPPIPLALKDVGVYHNIVRIGEDYLGELEVSGWNKFVAFFRTERVHIEPGQSIYVFSSVYAPTDLDTTIVHDWQYFDSDKIRWVSSSKIPFNIRGGRGEGYRGFTQKNNLHPGKWRVQVETSRGQVIGQIRFNVREVTTPVSLQNISL